MTAQQPDLRARDAAIARARGYEVIERDGGLLWMRNENGTDVLPRYSTDPGECARLLVEVMGRGWRIVDSGINEGDPVFTTVSIQMFKVFKNNAPITITSYLMDPVLAWCAAVSEACLKALEVGNGVD